MTGQSLELPWPDRRLHPNARVHWAQKAKAAKKARQDATWAAKASLALPIVADSLRVTAVFHPPDRRARDADGMLSSLKPALDGIADATGIDDSRWEIAIRRDEPRPQGAVIIQIEAIPCSQ